MECSLLARLMFLALLGPLASPGALAAVNSPRLAGTFNPKASPNRPDWQYFFKLSPTGREALWTRQSRAGFDLGAWSWQWRLGWVRACGDDRAVYCQRLLNDALFDKALVVRGEAATRLGRRFEGTDDLNARKILGKAFVDGRNARRGKPLYVQQRILYALVRLGPEGAKTAAHLASGVPGLTGYVARLEKSTVTQ